MEKRVLAIRHQFSCTKPIQNTMVDHSFSFVFLTFVPCPRHEWAFPLRFSSNPAFLFTFPFYLFFIFFSLSFTFDSLRFPFVWLRQAEESHIIIQHYRIDISLRLLVLDGQSIDFFPIVVRCLLYLSAREFFLCPFLSISFFKHSSHRQKTAPNRMTKVR